MIKLNGMIILTAFHYFQNNSTLSRLDMRSSGTGLADGVLAGSSSSPSTGVLAGWGTTNV